MITLILFSAAIGFLILLISFSKNEEHPKMQIWRDFVSNTKDENLYKYLQLLDAFEIAELRDRYYESVVWVKFLQQKAMESNPKIYKVKSK
jgi:hypothetical protein